MKIRENVPCGHFKLSKQYKMFGSRFIHIVTSTNKSYRHMERELKKKSAMTTIARKWYHSLLKVFEKSGLWREFRISGTRISWLKQMHILTRNRNWRLKGKASANWEFIETQMVIWISELGLIIQTRLLA